MGWVVAFCVVGSVGCGGTVTFTPREHDTVQIKEAGAIVFNDGRHGRLYRNRAYRCGQPDVQGDDGSLGWHEFGVAWPDEYDPDVAEPPADGLVIYAKLSGGGLGWVDVSGEHSGVAGMYMGKWERATAKWNRKRIRKFGEDLEQEGSTSLIATMRARHPEWAFMIPSQCSHDVYGGSGGNADFPRYGWWALAAAIKHLDETVGVRYVFAEGTSAGGSGVLMMARDLEEETGVPVRGVVMDSQAHEPDAIAELLDTTTDCDVSWEPASVAMDRAFVSGSATESIAGGELRAPIFHLWNRHDEQFCGDQAYSDAFLHGPIAQAIVDANPASRSHNREVCVDEPDDEVGTCEQHGLLEGAIDTEPGGREADITIAVADWIDALHTDWDGAVTSPSLR